MLITARKYIGMNLIDFIISYYGNVSYLDEFMQTQNYNNYSDFYTDGKSIYNINIPDNFFYNNYNPVISVDTNEIIEAIFEYNNDLTPKTVISGDFNTDFNIDFDINTLENIVVGFEGMNLYLNWSVNNAGKANGTISFDIAMTGYPLRTITQEIPGNSTYVFQTIFENVSSGAKVITVSSLYSTQTINIEVLPKAVFESLNDFEITTDAPYYDGSSITLSWSIINTGNATGTYKGTFRWSDKNGILYETEYITPIAADEIVTLEKTLTVYEGLYSFYSTENELLNINVLANINLPNLVYNNNLRLFNTTVSERIGNSILWSYTNTGLSAGYLNGYLLIEDADQKYLKSFTDIKGVSSILVDPGQTISFTEAFTPYASMNKVSIINTATVNFSVIRNQISKNLLWLSSTNGFVLVPNQEILNLTSGSNVYANVNIFNYSATNKTVNVKFELDDDIFFTANNYVVTSLDDLTVSTPITITQTGLHYIKVYLDSLYYGIVYINII